MEVDPAVCRENSFTPTLADIGTWILLAILVGLVFANSLAGELVLDSSTIVGADPRIRACTTSNVGLILSQNYWWPTWESDLYRPLTTLSYLFNYSVLGNELRPSGYHAANLVLHWLNCCLVYGLICRILRCRSIALVVAMLFAVHPITTEAVTNIVGRADLLVTLFLLIALNYYSRQGVAIKNPSVFGACLLFVASMGAVFSKESGIVLAGLMLLYDFVFFERAEGCSIAQNLMRRLRAGVWIHYACVLPAAALLLVIRHRMWLTSPTIGNYASDNPIVLADFWTGRMTALRVAGDYLRLIVWPNRLSCDYSHPQIPLFGWTMVGGDLTAWLMLVLLASVLIWSVVCWKTQRTAIFFLGLAGIAFLPVSNLVVVIGSIMGERLVYLPLIGGLGAAASFVLWISHRLPNAWPSSDRFVLGIGWCLAMAAVGALGWRTTLRNQDWQNESRIWTSAAEVCPNSFKVYKGQATAIARMTPDAAGLERAIERCERAAAILAAHPLPVVHMPSGVWLDLGRYCGRRAELIDSVGEDRATQLVWFRKSLVHLERAAEIDLALNQASRELRLAREHDPTLIYDVGQPEIYSILAVVQVGLENFPAAQQAADYQIRLAPNSGSAFLIAGYVNASAQHRDEAVLDFLSAMLLGEMNPYAWTFLDEFFSQQAPDPPAVQWTASGLTLNQRNRLADDFVNRACRQIVSRYLQANRFDLARETAQSMVDHHGRKPELFTNLIVP